MPKSAFVAGLVGAAAMLVVVGTFLVLDRTMLHVYFEEAVPTARPTATTVPTRWYYVPEGLARRLAGTYPNTIPPCSAIAAIFRRLPAPPNGNPIVDVQGSGGEVDTTVRFAIECRP
jgi:hypothetical protein